MKKHQENLDKWYKDNGWEYWSPHEMLASLVEEVGELSRLVNHIYGPKKKKDTEAKQEMEGEIGDILYSVMCFANHEGIDLDKAIERSMGKVEKRDKDRF
ncbi:MAG: MazG nucleotide pyrophosphohydrolase domain-containing protein [Patescibacteria group bacterium]|nr:MazG nucleotide pyrophosphohydrolase domain-containing protein [Patescibacteria group bacterium]